MELRNGKDLETRLGVAFSVFAECLGKNLTLAWSSVFPGGIVGSPLTICADDMLDMRHR